MISSNFEAGFDGANSTQQEIETRALIDYVTLFGGDVAGKIPSQISREITLYLEVADLPQVYGVIMQALFEMHKKLHTCEH